MKKVLVTGGNGFIAKYVINLLKDQGYLPITIVRSYYPASQDHLKGCIVYTGDIRDKGVVYKAVGASDGVINLAGILGTSETFNSPRETIETNILGSLNVFESAANWKVPLVQIAVGNHWEINSYSTTKTTAERLAIQFARMGNKFNVVRALNACGVGQKFHEVKKIIPTFFNLAIADKDINVYGGEDNCGLMDMVWVGDVAGILLDVLERTDDGSLEPGQIFEAGTGLGYSVWDVAHRIVEITQSKSKIVATPMRDGEGLRSAVIAQTPYVWTYKKLDKILLEIRDSMTISTPVEAWNPVTYRK